MILVATPSTDTIYQARGLWLTMPFDIGWGVFGAMCFEAALIDVPGFEVVRVDIPGLEVATVQ
jgi:hypothetical protein